MTKAFLSHSSKQKNLIDTIGSRLGRENVVIDKYNFEIGLPTLAEIFKGIGQADLFVLFLSDDALKSEWVQREISYAKNLQDKNNSTQILAFIVDSTISHQDSRIPSWLKDQYNLQTILDPILLYKKIDSRLRDLSIANHPFIKQKEEIFVGRNTLAEEFEKKYYNIELAKPTAIIASGIEGVGRRKFLKNVLDKVGRGNKFHEPITVSLDSRDSIEDLILRIEDLNSRKTEEVVARVKMLDLEEKVEYAKNLLLQFQQTNEILYILDKGCIVKPNKELVDWFVKIINNNQFTNNTSICLASTNRPLFSAIASNKKIISFHVNELSPTDRQILFVKYCELFGLSPSQNNIEKILTVLNGMPGQIFYTALMIHEQGSDQVISKLEEIRRHEDVKVYEIIDRIKNDGELFYNILLFISRFEFISYHFVYKIFKSEVGIDNVLDSLFIYGVYDRIGVDKEYIKVHHAISDYITRAKYDLDKKYKRLLKQEIKNIITNGEEYPDVSGILVTIKTLIQDGANIPDKYFIPSVVIRTIVELYYQKKYEEVNELAGRVVNNFRKYDASIIREIRYWHTMAYARRQKEEFFENLKYFTGIDYHFLLGFYKRVQKRFDEAEDSFREGLKIDQYSQKTRREMVNVLLTQKKYDDATRWAKMNYEKNKLNAFHIQGYFMCLTRKRSLQTDEKELVQELMENIKISHDYKAHEISLTMEGEYEYYVKQNFESALSRLKNAIDVCEVKKYPIKAVAEIYSRRGMYEREAQFLKMLPNQNETFLD